MPLSGSPVRFNREAAALIARQPDPPRSVNPLLAVLLFRGQLLIVTTCLAALLLVYGLPHGFRLSTLIVPAILAINGFGGIGWRSVRVFLALRGGLAARAQVLVVAAIGKDRVAGRYRVDGPTESFESEFVAGADLRLSPGSWLLVLVDRKAERVQLQLGVTEGSALSRPRTSGTRPAHFGDIPIRRGLYHYLALAAGLILLGFSGYLLDDYLRSVPASSAYRAAPRCAAGQQPTRTATCYASYPAVVTENERVLNGRGGWVQRATFAIEGGPSLQANVGSSSKAVAGLPVTVKVWHDRVTEIATESWSERTDDNPQRHTDNIGPAVIVVAMVGLMCLLYFFIYPRTAAWPRDPLAGLAVDLLRAQPQPPRMVDDGALFIAAFKASWPLASALTGLLVLFGVSGFAVPTDAGWQPGPYLMIATLVVVPPIGLLGLPALRMPRYRRTIRLGVPGVAVVETRNTSSLGAAQGIYRVEIAGRTPFVDRYFIELPAALEIAVGRRLEVLVDPERPKALLNVRVRPADEAAA